MCCCPYTGRCDAGFTGVNVGQGAECLKVKPGMEKLASRLETRRYGNMLGATTEWTKMEGITHDPIRGEFYMAMSTVYRSMLGADEDTSRNLGTSDDIAVRENMCG